MLDKNDEKTIGKIVREAIDVLVKPEFITINRKLDATMEMTAKNSEEITLLRDDLSDLREENKKEHGNMREDINILKEDVDDLKDTSTRIELGSRSVVKRQDDQGDQITKINQVLKLEPKVGR